MSNKNGQPVNGHFPPEWGISPEEVKTQIRKSLSGSQLFPGELEDCVNELLQETVQRYMRHAKDNDTDIRNPRSYILEIVRNACTEFLKQRKKKLTKEVPLPDAQEKEDSWSIESIPDERDQPELILLQKEGQDRLLSLIGQLLPPHRKVIKLKAEGADSREIAQRTSMSPATVGKYLREGRKELRQLLMLSERSK
jgi:RNA polymerase sigma factor (sigma-70 family)